MTTEQFRRECEARRVLGMPFHERKPYLELVGKRRGQAAQAELEAETKRQHKTRKGA